MKITVPQLRHWKSCEICQNQKYSSFSTSFKSYCRNHKNSVATNLENMENMENSENLKNCQNFRKNSRKFEFLWEKTGKVRENEKYVTWLPTKMYSIEFSSFELLREKFKDALEISGKTQGI